MEGAWVGEDGSSASSRGWKEREFVRMNKDIGGVGQNVFSYQRIMCSLTKEKNDLGGVGQNVFSYQRMCSLTRDCVLLLEKKKRT